jgi:hypothetical protein
LGIFGSYVHNYLGLSSKRARAQTSFKHLDNGRKATIF